MGRDVAVTAPADAARRAPRHGAYTKVRALLAAALIGGVASSGVVASWAGSEAATAELRTGSFSLVSRTNSGAFVDHGEGAAAAIAWPTSPLLPGQSLVGTVQIRSAGTVAGAVRLTGVRLGPVAGGSADAALRDALTVRVSATTSPDGATTDCTASTPGVESLGLGSIPALSSQPLQPAGASTVTYCIVVTLPSNAPSAAQGGQLAPVWVFTGISGG